MKLKPLALITTILVALAIFVSLPNGADPSTSDDPFIGQSPLTAEDARALARLEITPASGDPIVLQADANGAWVTAQDAPLPVDLTLLRGLITSLRENEVNRFVTALPERKERLNLDNVRLTLYGADSKAPLLDLQVGRASSDGGTYVQPAGSEKAYLLDGSLSPATTYSAWTDKTPLDSFEVEDVAAVSVELGENAAPLNFSRNEGDFILEGATEGESAQSAALETLARNLRNLRYTSTTPATDAAVVEAQTFARRYTLQLAEGGTLSVSIGRRPARSEPAPEIAAADESDTESETSEPETIEIPAGKAYALITLEGVDSPWVQAVEGRAFEVAEWTFNQLPDTREDLVAVEADAAEEEE